MIGTGRNRDKRFCNSVQHFAMESAVRCGSHFEMDGRGVNQKYNVREEERSDLSSSCKKKRTKKNEKKSLPFNCERRQS